MKKAAFVVLAAMAVGCGAGGSSSDPFGAEPNYDEVQRRFDHPDGTLSAGNAAGVFATTSNSGSANVGGVFSAGSSSSTGSSGAPGTVTSKSLRILGNGAGFSCSALEAGQRSGTCACPTSGSFTYEVAGGGNAQSSDTTMKLRIDACTSGAASVNGTEFLHMTSNAGSVTMLFVVDVDVTDGGATHHFDLQESYATGKVQLAARVDDGWVVVSIESSGANGTLTVRDRNGTWSCTEANGAGTCTSDTGQHVAW